MACLVQCLTHGHYLVRASDGGTKWSDDKARARRYPSFEAAREAADKARWLDHRPGIEIER